MDGVDPVVRRAQGGEEAAFNELFRRHRGDVTRIVTRVLGASAEVEDVVQDVFIHVYRSLPKFRGDSKFTTWLYRLTVNVTRMHLRRGRSRPRFADVPVPDAPRDSTPPDRPDLIHERAERMRALESLLDRLSEKKRTVLVLHDLEGMPAKDIAEIVEAPVLTVRTRLFYARKELFAALADDPHLASVVESFLPDLPGKPRAAESAAKVAPPGAHPVVEESK
jgi:RNA polymerase sigma-70 factor (ECF subfamily)